MMPHTPDPHEKALAAGATANQGNEPARRETGDSTVSVPPSTPTERTPTAYILLSLVYRLGDLFAAAGVTADEFEQLANFPRGRLVAALARPERMTVVDVLRATRAADIDWLDFWQQVEDGARVIAAQVLDGTACRRCGRAFVVGATSRPDGFGEHGQLFACAPRWGCTLDEQFVDDEPAAAPRPGDRFAIRQELADGTVGYEPVTVISVGAYVQADGVADTEMVGLVELEPIELADLPPVAEEGGKPLARALGYVAEIRAREGEQ